jgi:hypothetical protein
MANTFLNIDMITLEALAILENQLTFSGQVRRKYDSSFAKTGAKIGDTLRVRKPARYLGRTGQGFSPEAITESSVNVTLTTQFGVDLEMTSEDLALRIDDFSNRILKPAIARIANKYDDDGMQLYKQVNAFVGTPTTAITTLEQYLNAGAILDEQAAPNDGDRCIVLRPSQQVSIVNGLVTIFNPSAEISRQYKKGIMGQAAGFAWYMDQNAPSHTVGTIVGTTPVMNGATASGATTLVTDGWTSGGLNVGDIVNVASVNSVNPQNYRTTGRSAAFVVTAACTVAGGAMTIPVQINGGAIIGPGSPFQNVDALPADEAAISVFGVGTIANVSADVTPTGLAFHPDFATGVCADLPLPKGTDMAGRKADDQLGLSIRFIRDYDPVTDQMVNRFDLLYGWAALRPELAVRICS